MLRKGRDALSEKERESAAEEKKIMSGAARTEARRRGSRYKFVGTRHQSAPYLFLMGNVKLPLKSFCTFLPKSPGALKEKYGSRQVEDIAGKPLNTTLT